MGVCGTEPTIEIVGWWLRCPVGTGSFLFLRVAEDCDAGEVKQRDDAYAGADEAKGLKIPSPYWRRVPSVTPSLARMPRSSWSSLALMLPSIRPW